MELVVLVLVCGSSVLCVLVSDSNDKSVLGRSFELSQFVILHCSSSVQSCRMSVEAK
jgi:hypothetical protein